VIGAKPDLVTSGLCAEADGALSLGEAVSSFAVPSLAGATIGSSALLGLAAGREDETTT